MFSEEIICPQLKQTSQQEHVLVSPAPSPHPIPKKKKKALNTLGREGRKEEGCVWRCKKHTVVPKRCESQRGESELVRAALSVLSSAGKFPPLFKPLVRLSLLPLISCKGNKNTAAPSEWILHILSLSFLCLWLSLAVLVGSFCNRKAAQPEFGCCIWNLTWLWISLSVRYIEHVRQQKSFRIYSFFLGTILWIGIGKDTTVRFLHFFVRNQDRTVFNKAINFDLLFSI